MSARTLSRRRFASGLVAGSASCLLVGCGDADAPAATGTCRDEALRPLSRAGEACDASFEALVREILESPRSDLLQRVGAHLESGTDLGTLLAANFHAGILALTPSAGAVIHGILGVNSVNLLGAAMRPADQLAAVLWSTDNVKGEQGPAQTPLPPLDEANLPGDAAEARSLLVAGLEDFDAEAADLGAAGMLRHAERSDLVDLLLRHSALDRTDAHRQIFPGQCFRALDAFGWGCAETVVRFLGRVLAEGSPDATEFEASVAVAEAGVNLDGTDCDLARAVDLLKASRVLTPAEMRESVVTALGDGLCLDTLWDALLAASAEIVLRGNGGGGLHTFDAINALRSGASRASTPELRALLVLQGAVLLPSARLEGSDYNNPPPFREIEIDLLERGTAPSNVEALFERSGLGRGYVYDPSPAHDTFAWFEAGGSVCEYVTRGRELVVEKGNVDAHFYKFPVAVFEEIERVDPFWVPRLLATEVLVNPGSTAEDWTRLDEARALAADLGLS